MTNKNTKKNEINKAAFRFYEELNDFLPPDKKKKNIEYFFKGNPSVKDAVEAMGIPHPEIDLIIVNGNSVDFSYQLNDSDRIAVYPRFESMDISPILKLRPSPLRTTLFILDIQLGKLAKMLRMLGFDTLFDPVFNSHEIVNISLKQNRIILTKDRALLKLKPVTHGYWVRSTIPDEQIKEIIKRFDLKSSIDPFTRCIICNSKIVPVEKIEIEDILQEKTRLFYNTFQQCTGCGRVFWKGPHYQKMIKKIEKLRSVDF
ncbi:Mut7-C ubiquitin/RNAse domain-containing protein [bacterium]|nr:Mut7-C ubiquitin/RNAse domain-containing protein [bacterium]